jgi:hypothetical protein
MTHRILGALTVAFLTVTLAFPARLLAQGHASSPYSGQETREIKALSPEEIRALAAGEGMGLAKAAELNGLPGPLHVLQSAEALGLKAEQRAAVQVVFDRMKAAAVTTGLRIVELERELDWAFAARAIDAAGLERKVADIARLQGQLRTIHLKAHLETLPLLSASQVHRYQVLRGYAAGADSPEVPAHGHGAGGLH